MNRQVVVYLTCDQSDNIVVFNRILFLIDLYYVSTISIINLILVHYYKSNIVINPYHIIWHGLLLIINIDFNWDHNILFNFNSRIRISSHSDFSNCWNHMKDTALMSDSTQIIPIVPINNIYELMNILLIQLMDSTIFNYIILFVGNNDSIS